VVVDVQAQLNEDGEPDIVGSNDKMVVLVVGVDSGIDEAIALGADGVIKIICLERRLKKLLAVGVLLVARTLQELLRRGTFVKGVRGVCLVRGGLNSHWHAVWSGRYQVPIRTRVRAESPLV